MLTSTDNNRKIVCATYVDYKFIVFLYAYFRQIYLSVDRSRWQGEWPRFLSFYKKQRDPIKIIECVYNYIEKYNSEPQTYDQKIKYQVLCFFHRKSFMTRNEVTYTITLLHRLNILLNSGFTAYNIEAEILWMDAITFMSTLERKLKGKDICKVMPINHFNQHDDNIAIPIEKFGNYGV